MIYPKEFVSIIGDTGLGKTAFSQNIAVVGKLPTLFLELEVGADLLYRRFIQIKYNMTKEEVEQQYRDGFNSLYKGIDHIQFMSTAPYLDTIERLTADLQPKLIIVDTVEDIQVKASNPLERLDHIGRGLKQIANNQNVIIIGIHHISKSAAQDSEGRRRALTVHSGKGASTIEQKADKVISVEGVREEDYRMIRSLKSRDEEPFKKFLTFNKETFRFIEKEE